MSTFKLKNNLPTIGRVVTSLATKIRENGAGFSSPENVTNMLSLESLSEHNIEVFERNAEELRRDIEDTLKASLEGIEFTDTQLDSGVVAALAAGDVESYHAAATNLEVSTEGAVVVDPVRSGKAGILQYLDKVSVESFDTQELSKHIPYSITWNVQASRQDAFGEAFYPTVVVTPDQAGLDISVNRTMVLEEVRHQTSGKVVSWNRRSLLDATIDSTILANDATRVVPVVLADDSNADKFVDATLVPPAEVLIDRIPVLTAPLAIGQEVDLLGISENQGLIGAGLMDSTDSIDARVGLEQLFISLTADVDDGSGGTISATEVYKFNVSRMPRADFVKSTEGDHREMNLVFSTDSLILRSDTMTAAGASSVILDALAANNLELRLKVNASGSINLETSHLNIYGTTPDVSAVYEVDTATNVGTELALTDTAAAAAIAAIGEIAILGYTLNATRSNMNLRTRGLLLNMNKYVERYTIPMGSPISVPSPAASDRSASDLTSLISAARISISNNAVTSLLNYAAALSDYVNDLPTFGEDGATVEGIGRYLVKPFFEELELDLTSEINSTTSHERNADVKALLVDAIREISYRAYRDSNYQAACDAVTGVAGSKPRLVIGTDATIAQHLMVTGDERTASIAFDHEVVASSDRRMYGKIVFSFVRSNSAGADALSFGCHAWIPELTSTMTVSRNGATVKETTVQPRSRHINILPVMGVINVTGLDVLRTRVISESTVTP